MTKRRRTPVGTQPPPPQSEDRSWLDGSWLEGLLDAPGRDLVNAEVSVWPEVSEVHEEPEPEPPPVLARGSNPPRTLPRAVTSEPTGEAAGMIDTDAKFDLHDVDAHVEAHAAVDPSPDQERSVIVQIDDDWLARLDLPPE